MVNINKATKQQLVSVLSGIGEKKAKAIVDYRNKHGAFKSANDLLKVKGIGKKILAKNKTKISLKGKTVVGHSDKVKKAKSSKKKLVAK
ncbi:MAG: helix-hairpin-helix domain-containing protein [Gammaproteobacteria bacterium]|nr:helix-hairpin-helix domain-containing protein [Gammaproteobacteria bacterium]